VKLIAIQNDIKMRAGLLALAIVATVSTAHADLVDNGSFSQLTTNASSQINAGTQPLVGWTGTGLAFVFLPGTIDTTGAPEQGQGAMSIWGPGNGSNNGLTASPAGGNIIGLDGDQTPYYAGSISQTLTNLTVGSPVTVSFYFAGAQQAGFYSATTEQLEVSLGSQNEYTQVLDNVSEGFTGWNEETMTFTPTSASETLTFLAIGTPIGEPPMSLLSDVTVTQPAPTPEPSSLLLLGTGFAGMSGLVRRRFKRS
jgi:PEP-CTERM motif